MKIALAVNSDGERIRELVEATQGVIVGLDWSSVHPYWIVAVHQDRIVGCVNVALSNPIGRLDLLAIDPSLRPHARGRAVRALIAQGLATLKKSGASASISQIPFPLQSYKRLLKKHFGAIVVGQGNMMLRVLK